MENQKYLNHFLRSLSFIVGNCPKKALVGLVGLVGLFSLSLSRIEKEL